MWKWMDIYPVSRLKQKASEWPAEVSSTQQTDIALEWSPSIQQRINEREWSTKGLITDVTEADIGWLFGF